ncbi:hypothetical protein EB74_06790 [Mycobacterium sp. SWH-M5]|nr:hypothetical protein EB74_06790 [Mycobacterium sp. SWH-M5]
MWRRQLPTIAGRVRVRMPTRLQTRSTQRSTRSARPAERLRLVVAAGRVGEVIDYTGLDPGATVENAIKHFIEAPEYKALTVPDDDILMAGSNVQAQQTVLEAAMKAGELPDELKRGNSPVQISELGPDSREYQIVQKYLIERGLAQYVTDYAQSYSSP